MDPETIYTKTAFGEEAMHQRTRVMQRNVRMVLILVDGQSTVADLSLKTGSAELTETALKELEKGGFVEPAIDQDSLWAESKRVAQEIRSAAIDKALQLLPNKSKAAARGAEPSMATPPKHSGSGTTGQGVDPRLSQFSLAHFQTSELPGIKPIGSVSSKAEKNSSKGKSSWTSSSFEEESTSMGSKIRQFFGRSDADRKIPVSIKPIRRGPRRAPFGWPLRLMLFVVFLAVLVYLTASFFPYHYYLPEVQAAASELLGRPVKAAQMRVDIYPKPGVFLEDVSIGSGGDTLHIAELQLQPEPLSLNEPRKQLREVVVRGVVLSAKSLSGLQALLASVAKPSSAFSIKHLVLEKVEAKFGALALPEMNGDATLSSTGAFQSVVLHSEDGALTLALVPQGSAVDVSFDGFGWRASPTSPWRFDSISLKGVVESGVFAVNHLDLRIFDGVVQGKLALQGDGDPAMSGDVSFERIDSGKLGEALGLGSQLSGDVAGDLRFSTTADAWASIFTGLSADGQFSAQRGSIQGIDLTEAVRRVTVSPVQGGSTQFEQLSGKIKLSPKALRLTNINLSSGLMQSAGFVQVSKDLDLRGEMELRMRGSVNQTRVPVSIGGTLKAPELQARNPE